ncbi:MAG TPA: addiction module protein [Pyrinomonadaceae bacterium]|nr:addiction module protein [Pyrinomonadaceae bacterium]
MSTTTDDLVSTIKKLPYEEKIRIVDAILTDLPKRNPEIAESWSNEVAKRWAAFKSGKLSTVSYEEVIAKHRR